MSYGWSSGLQAAVYGRLRSDGALGELVGAAIYDAPLDPPAEDAAGEYVTLGEEIVRPWGTKTSEGAIHDFEVAVHSQRDGFAAAKRIAGALCAALIDAPLEVEGGRVVGVRFLRAKAERGRAPEKRKVSLRFRAVLDADE